MRIKATIVAYAFSVQCFENATIVAYAGLRVKLCNANSFFYLSYEQLGHVLMEKCKTKDMMSMKCKRLHNVSIN